MESVQRRACAKLNLFLDVVARRADGFHELVTVFHEIDLADDVEVRRSPDPGVRLELEGASPDVPTGAENLVVRAVHALVGANAVGLAVSLRKHIPSGGGLGGGSADAAHVLAAVDQLLSLRTPPERLAALALELGSDVPFFLLGGTALGRGRGELLTPVEAPVPLRFALFLPPFGIPTGAVFRALPRELPPARDPGPVLAAIRAGDPEALAASFHNSLEPAAEQVEPRLEPLRRELTRACGRRVCLSGSGSTLFVPLAEDEPTPTAPSDVRVVLTRSAAAR